MVATHVTLGSQKQIVQICAKHSRLELCSSMPVHEKMLIFTPSWLTYALILLNVIEDYCSLCWSDTLHANHLQWLFNICVYTPFQLHFTYKWNRSTNYVNMHALLAQPVERNLGILTSTVMKFCSWKCSCGADILQITSPMVMPKQVYLSCPTELCNKTHA